MPILVLVPTLFELVSPFPLVLWPPHSPTILLVYTRRLRPSTLAPPPLSLSSIDPMSPFASDPSLLLCERVNILVLPNILSVSLSLLVLCPYHFLALFLISLVFLSLRQCKMHYLTLVGALWN
jgi:hypothetical protein